MKAIQTDYTQARLDPPTRALLDYTVKVTREAWTCTEDDIQRLRAHGFTDEDIIDATAVIAQFNFINRMVDALGVTLNPEFLTTTMQPVPVQMPQP